MKFLTLRRNALMATSSATKQGEVRISAIELQRCKPRSYKSYYAGLIEYNYVNNSPPDTKFNQKAHIADYLHLQKEQGLSMFNSICPMLTWHFELTAGLQRPSPG